MILDSNYLIVLILIEFVHNFSKSVSTFVDGTWSFLHLIYSQFYLKCAYFHAACLPYCPKFLYNIFDFGATSLYFCAACLCFCAKFLYFYSTCSFFCAACRYMFATCSHFQAIHFHLWATVELHSHDTKSKAFLKHFSLKYEQFRALIKVLFKIKFYFLYSVQSEHQEDRINVPNAFIINK